MENVGLGQNAKRAKQIPGSGLGCSVCLTRGGSRGRVQGVRIPRPWNDLRFSNTTGILQKKKKMWFIGVEAEQETSAPPPKKKSWIRPC